jgi:hypothetical protein
LDFEFADSHTRAPARHRDYARGAMREPQTKLHVQMNNADYELIEQVAQV